MFDTTWKKKSPAGRLDAPATSCLAETDVEAVVLLEWAEHCLECAPPDCYATCVKYRRREDLKCARLSYGIAPNPDFSGALPYGADVRFEDWGKLECTFDPKRLALVTPERNRGIAQRTGRTADAALAFSRTFKPVMPSIKPVGALTRLRRDWINRQHSDPAFSNRLPDAFVIECHSFEDAPFQLKVECDLHGQPFFADSVTLAPGPNYFEIPFARFGFERISKEGQTGLRVFPEDNLNCRLVFSWLDFVAFAAQGQTLEGAPADKAKCVAWDLDNTLWHGVLIENGNEALKTNQKALEAIRELDRRGIIHTIISKNTHEEAWAVLERLGLDEYFVYPAINWGAKSENLKEIARRMNINIDTFVVVDDSAHERAEIGQRLPMVRLFSDEQIDALLAHPALDLPITEMSAKRRQTYRDQEQREVFQESFGTNYADYLRSLEIEAEIFIPATEAERDRCFELLQRTNQLNLRSYRYTRAEFDDLLQDAAKLSYGFRVRDRFGAYGIVGFITIRLGVEPQINDLVISCRIAQKRIEYAIVARLCQTLRERGFSTLEAMLKRTRKNGLLVSLFAELPFCIVADREETLHYRIDDLTKVIPEDIVTVSLHETVPETTADC